MKSIKFFLSAFGVLLTPLAPQSVNATPLKTDGRGWFARAGIGLAKPDFQDAIHVKNGSGFPPPLHHDVYSTTRETAVTAALAAGYTWYREQTWLPAIGLGLNYQHLFSNEMNGTITQYSLPQFKNYQYQWHINSEALTVFSKIHLIQYQRLSTYVEGRLGPAWNTTSAYGEKAFSGVTPRISPGFRNHTFTQFTYSLGAGVDFIVTEKFIVSLGYEFNDWGTIDSKPGELTWSQERLNAGRYQTHSGLLSVTYLFGQSPAHLSK